MYGIYDDIIGAAQKSLESFDEIEELLEYPEVQADRGYYLSILSKYNNLKFLKDKLAQLTTAIQEERTAANMLAEVKSLDERDMLYDYISSRKKYQAKLSDVIADALGGKKVSQKAYCCIKTGRSASKVGVELIELVKAYLISRGAEITCDVAKTCDGYVEESSFVAAGEDVINRLTPLAGAHKVRISPSRSEVLRFAVTPMADSVQVSDDDLKIELFHSSGAGGQNVNKVETAVRVTHIPTGLVAVCQDERSQLSNKKRALERILIKLKEKNERQEKERIEADIRMQFAQKNTPLSFNLTDGTVTDARLTAFVGVPFPMSNIQFAQYLNSLAAL